ncbi:hypothetical protein T492DRAFT_1099667 [Pavlovales sp. CCMP2436]|nr:hypothetical protein T492DRAFT_1099667 [Pavlovales sp. CCMP2436]
MGAGLGPSVLVRRRSRLFTERGSSTGRFGGCALAHHAHSRVGCAPHAGDRAQGAFSCILRGLLGEGRAVPFGDDNDDSRSPRLRPLAATMPARRLRLVGLNAPTSPTAGRAPATTIDRDTRRSALQY